VVQYGHGSIGREHHHNISIDPYSKNRGLAIQPQYARHLPQPYERVGGCESPFVFLDWLYGITVPSLLSLVAFLDDTADYSQVVSLCSFCNNQGFFVILSLDFLYGIGDS
jgi:hypothetical protein